MHGHLSQGIPNKPLELAYRSLYFLVFVGWENELTPLLTDPTDVVKCPWIIKLWFD